MLRLPGRLLDAETARSYCPEGDPWAGIHVAQGYTILLFEGEKADPVAMELLEDGSLGALTPLRDELARGDHRALYLGWLHRVQLGEVSEEVPEPPVPPGMDRLSASQRALADFLDLDDDLLDAVAESSAAFGPDVPDVEAFREWIAGLPEADKDTWLTRLVTEMERSVTNELIQLWRREQGGAHAATARRTVEELLEAASRRREERQRREEEERTARRARREREEATARAAYLDQLMGREASLWQEIERAIAATKPKEYDRAVARLVDLRDLARRRGKDEEAEFADRLAALRAKHSRKRTLLQRLDKAGLGSTFGS